MKAWSSLVSAAAAFGLASCVFATDFGAFTSGGDGTDGAGETGARAERR